MVIERFPIVRQDTHVVVYTEHPDHIHPQDLSDTCLTQYGENRFKIALLRNIYVIYVQRAPLTAGSVSLNSSQLGSPC
jgi:hypothetical protein